MKIADTMSILEWQKQTRDLKQNDELQSIQREREMLQN